MKCLAILALAALAACGRPAPAASSVASAPEYETFLLQSEALVGLWSFDRSCGLYDLVLEAGGAATLYDYGGDQVVMRTGSWAVTENNRVVLNLQLTGPDGAPAGDPVSYNLDVAAPVTDNLVAGLARADSAEARDIDALRCPDEDRD